MQPPRNNKSNTQYVWYKHTDGSGDPKKRVKLCATIGLVQAHGCYAWCMKKINKELVKFIRGNVSSGSPTKAPVPSSFVTHFTLAEEIAKLSAELTSTIQRNQQTLGADIH